MQIDWATLSLFVMGFFAVTGFFRGWWREALTTVVLALFMLLLQQPDLADAIVTMVNAGIAAVWDIAAPLLNSFISVSSTPLQLDSSQGTTWVVLFFGLLAVVTLFTRILLPGEVSNSKNTIYQPNILGRILGLGLGLVNGFLILGLLREFMDGRALPGQAEQSAATASAAGGDITVLTDNAYGAAAQTVAVEFTDLPTYTIMDNIIPWVVIGVGLLIVFAIFQTRVSFESKPEGRKVDFPAPLGYKQIGFKNPKAQPPMKVEVIE
jgi:hypothetical protein